MKSLLSAAACAAFGFVLAACTPPPAAKESAAPHVVAADQLAAGRYLVTLGGCNDCHTAGYAENSGNVADTALLTGNPIGFRGPWGVSYPANLRLTVQSMTEDQWASSLKTRVGLPPMPWDTLHKLDEQDLRAMYQYIKSLPPGGAAMPAAVPPGEEPKGAYYYYVPITGKAPH